MIIHLIACGIFIHTIYSIWQSIKEIKLNNRPRYLRYNELGLITWPIPSVN